MRRFLVAFPLLWPPTKKRTAEAEEALDQGFVIPTHLPQIPHLLQLQRKKQEQTTQIYIIVPTKEKSGHGKRGATNTLAITDGEINHHKHKSRFVQIPAFVFKSKRCSVKVIFI